MRRSLFTRLTGAVMALWFATVLGDPAVLHACPEHGAHAAHGSHASHQVAGEHGKAPAKSSGCTCIGTCCAAPAAAPLPQLATFAVSTAIVPAVALPESSPEAPAAPAVRLLPFATAPPQA